MKTVRLEGSPCPKCGKKLDAATPVGNEESTPAPGVYTVCVYCRTFLRFGKNMELIALTPDELMRLPKKLMTMMMAVRTAAAVVIKDNNA